MLSTVEKLLSWSPLPAGAPAPPLSLTADDGTWIKLPDFKGHLNVLLVFFRSADVADTDRFLREVDAARTRFEALDTGSPLTLAEGEPDQPTRRLIASITARYSDRRNQALVEVAARRGDTEERLMVPPVADAALEGWRI